MRTLVLLFLLSFTCAAFGQISPPVFKDFDVSYSKPYPVIDGAKSYINIDGYSYVFKENSKRMHVQQFDLSGTPVLKNQNTILDLPPSYSDEGLIKFWDKTYFFFSVYDKENEREQLFVREMDLEELALKGTTRELKTVDGKLLGSAYMMVFGIGAGVVDKFRFNFTDDNSKFMIRYTYKAENRSSKKKYTRVGYQVYDRDLNMLWENDVQLERSLQEQYIIGYEMDNDGNVFIVTKVWHDDSRKNFVKDDLNYHLEVLKVESQTGAITSFEIDLENKAHGEISFNIGEDQNLIITGTYKVDARNAHADGIYYIKTDLNGNLLARKFHDIPMEVINMHRSKKVVKKNLKNQSKGKTEDVYFPYLDMVGYRFAEDGGVFLHGQTSYSQTRTNSKGYTSETYHRENIFACKLDHTGEVMWMQSLGKNQASGAKLWGGMSYKHLYIGDHHYFVFLDHYNNERLPIDRVAAMYQDNQLNKGRLVAYRVDGGNGNVSKLNILDTQKVPINGVGKPTRRFNQFGTYRVRPAPGNAFAIEMYAGDKKEVFLKVDIKE